jgi:hypothetical protein
MAQELTREEAVARLEEAHGLLQRATQTVERYIHLAENGSADDLRALVTTAEREVEAAHEALRPQIPGAPAR